MRASDEETKFRVTRYMNRILSQLVERDGTPSKKQFCTSAVENNIEWLEKSLKGQRKIYHLVSNLNDDIEWLNMDVSGDYLTAKAHVNKDLDVVRTLDLNDDTHGKVGWCAESSAMSRSAVIRLCVIKEVYHNRDMLNEARSIQVSERWLEIKSKVRLRTEKLIDELYYNFSTEYVEHKLQSDLEAKNLMILSSHYKTFKHTEGHDVMLEYDRGRTVVNTLDSLSDLQITQNP